MKHKTPRCHQCGCDLVHRIAPPHRVKMRYEGSPHDVIVENLPEWHCAPCNISVTDGESDKSLQDALRNHIGLLSPQQIKAGLKELRISQDKFAERLGCAAESVSRWLNGAVLQSRAYDRLMRIYFHCPEVRGLLENFTPESSFGTAVVKAEAAHQFTNQATSYSDPFLALEMEASFLQALKATMAAYLASSLFTRLGSNACQFSADSNTVFPDFGASESHWASLCHSQWDWGGSAPRPSTNRIPQSIWNCVGGEAA